MTTPLPVINRITSFTRRLLLGSTLLLATIAFADAYRDEMQSVAAWQSMPQWIGSPSPHAAVTSDGNVADFAVPEPGKGMKWRRPIIPNVSTDEANWLLIRYRAVNCSTTGTDYALWLGGGASHDMTALRQQDLVSDGQWHLRVVDLTSLPALTVKEMALQVLASKEGDAHLFIDYIAFSDELPAGAEGIVRNEPVKKQVLLNPGKNEWRAVPSWLDNPAPTNASRIVSTPATGAGSKPLWRFELDAANHGMKWTTTLAEPVSTTTQAWLVVRYRAENLRAVGDYFMHLSGKTEAGVRSEAKPLMLSGLEDDGGWHLATVAVTAMRVSGLTVHLQARQEGAFVEIAELGFSSAKPESSLRDCFTFQAGWPATAEQRFTPIALTVPATADAASAFRRDGFDGRWFESDQVEVEGVPFRVKTTSPQLAATGLKNIDQLAMEINAAAETIYLLLGGRFVGEEDQSRGGGAMRHVQDVERFVIELLYADGVRDWLFPQQLPTGRYAIKKGFGVYAAVPTRPVAIKQLVLHDEMDNGAFYLAGVTLGKERWAKAATPRALPVTATAPKEIAPGKGTIRRENDRLIFENNAMRLILSVADGLEVVSLSNRFTNVECLQSACPLFDFENGKLTSKQFKPTEIRLEESIARIQCVSDRLKILLTAKFNDAGELALGLTVSNSTPQPQKLSVTFPTLANIRLGATPSDLHYCFPRRGAVVNNIPITLGEPYSGQFPMQFMDFFAPQCGGFYLMTHDRDCVYKWFALTKGRDGVGEARIRYIEYEQDELAPGAALALPETVLGMHGGDWHDGLTAYKSWVQGWHQPLTPRQDWFRQVFNFRQQCLHFGMPEKSGMFDEKAKAFHFEQALQKDREAFGAVDYLHLFDWGYAPAMGRTGDYAPWDYLGGSENLKQAIGQTQPGTPVGLYMEGYLIDPKSRIAQAHGKEWEMLDRAGRPYSYFAPEMNICSAIPAWQDYLAQTYHRVALETGAAGFYIDEMGFADMRHFCYSAHHGHKLPEPPLRGQRELIRKIRQALPAKTVLYTEENPVDVISQYQDGSFTYAISSVSDDWSPSHLNLMRFAFPDFKTIEIITCDHPLRSDYQSVKKIFFNGEAIWLEGVADQWFAPATLAFIRKMNSLQRAHADAFTGLHPRPLVPTLREGLYANEFPSDTPGKVLWTLYNANHQTVRGNLLAVPHQPGAVYRDAWNNRELQPQIRDGMALLSVEIDPRGVGCVVQSVPNNR